MTSFLAQSKPPVGKDSSGVYTLVQQPAEFPGGVAELNKFISTNLATPASAMEAGIRGTVFVNFVITSEGKIKNIKTLREIKDCPECSKEAIRVVSILPDWNAAKQDGNKVDCYFILPIKFPPNK